MTMDKIPTDMLLSSDSLAGITSWIFNPLPEVGSNVAPLSNCPAGLDWASKVKCSTQSYTSWDCVSRSYVGAYTFFSEPTRKKREISSVDLTQLDPDTPTDEEISGWDQVEKEMYAVGKKMYFRGVGLLTKAQMKQTKYIKALLARPVHRDQRAINYPNSYNVTNVQYRRIVNEWYLSKLIYDQLSQTQKQNLKRATEEILGEDPVDEAYTSHFQAFDFKQMISYDTLRGWAVQASRVDPNIWTVEYSGNKRLSTNDQPKWEVPADVQPYSRFPASRYGEDQDQRRLAVERKSTLLWTAPKPIDATFLETKPDTQVQIDSGPVTRSQQRKLSMAESETPSTNEDEGGSSGSTETPKKDTNNNSKRTSTTKVEHFFYSDMMPVKVCGVRTWKCEYERNMAVPYSPFFTQLLQRLQDPSATGLLGSVARGPSIRDATSMISLAKALQKTSSTVLEIAPLVRLGCMIMSLDSDCYKTEIIYYRFLRRWKTVEVTGFAISDENSDTKTPNNKCIAMPLDGYVTFMLNKYGRDQVNPNFPYSSADSSWVAIPIRSEMLGSIAAVPYIVSFLSSAYWNGRVNFRMKGTLYDVTAKKDVSTAITLMPSCNSVYIPGPSDFILVLVDYSLGSVPTNVNVGGVDIPVWNGTPIVPVDFSPAWTALFNVNSLQAFRTHCVSAYNEICSRLAVEDTCQIAQSITAELYIAMYNGIGIIPKAKEAEYDYSVAAKGAWTYNGESTICEGSRVKTNSMAKDNQNQNRRRTVGFNFSSLSPLHQAPSGAVHTRTTNDDNGCFVFWMYKQPSWRVARYELTQVDSITRVSIYLDLILTHEKTMSFSNAQGFSSWHHMLGLALSSQTSMFLAQNNVNLALWSGFDNRYDEVCGPQYMSTLVSAVTQKFVNFYVVKDMIQKWTDWDEDIIFEYYGLDPFDCKDWNSNSPVPFHLTVQWIEKMQHQIGKLPDKLGNFRHNGNKMGILLNEQAGQYRMLTYCTTLTDKYHPICVLKEEDANFSHLISWVDQFSYISCVATLPTLMQKEASLESQSFVVPPLCNALPYKTVQPMWVVNSDFVLSDKNYASVTVKSIEYPDPITLSGILSGAKNWILDPLLSAIMGFVGGGPTGALIGGGSRLAEKIIDKFVPEKEKETYQDARKKVEQVAAEANLKIHGVDTHKAPRPIHEEIAQSKVAVSPTNDLEGTLND